MGTHGANYAMVNSEVMWLLALEQETNLTLQKPIKNKDGRLVTRISQEGNTTHNCTLLGWVEGEPYSRDLESEQTAYQIGVTLATLHNHASRWKKPDGFSRPNRDISYFENMLKGLLPAVKDGRIRMSNYAELSKSVSLLIEIMKELEETTYFYGIIHADPHKGNMLYHEGKIRLIDFSFCAFGNYMFDLGICLGDMKEELHWFCLEGYRSVRELPINYQKLIEGFFLGSIIGTFSFWVSNPLAQEILAKKVPQIIKDFATKFNQRKRFWFSS
jgi:Ser/Thr protein kinase RdoA (MazF antagonist)